MIKEAYIALAVAAEEAKRDEDAQFALEKLVEISPDQAEIYRELANVYLRTGQKDKAEAMLAKVDSLGGQQDPNVLYNLGAERFNASDFEAAAGFFARAASAKPEFAEAHLRLGYCQLNLGKKAEAIASLKRFLELQPQGEDAKTARELLQALEKK